MAELEVFDSGMINYACYLIRKQLLKPPYYFNLILGNIACAQADLLHNRASSSAIYQKTVSVHLVELVMLNVRSIP